MKDLRYSEGELQRMKMMGGGGGGFINLDTDGQQSVGGGVGYVPDGFFSMGSTDMPSWMVAGTATSSTALIVGGLVALGIIAGIVAWATKGRRKK